MADILRGLALVLGLSSGACSYTLDDSAPVLPLVGEAIAPAAFPKLNPDGVPINDVYVLSGVGDAPWAVLVAAPIEPLPPPVVVTPQPMMAYLVPLSPGGTSSVVQADQIMVSNRLIYLTTADPLGMSPTVLSLVQPGAAMPPRMLSVPPGNVIIVPSLHDEAFLYVATGDTAHVLNLQRSDGSFQRQLPLPDDVDATNVFDKFKLFFDTSGDHLISQDSDGNLVAHSTLAETDVALGKADISLLWNQSRNAVISCGANGLWQVPIDGSPQIELDAGACQPDVLGTLDNMVFYKRDDALYLSTDAGVAPMKVVDPPVEQLLGIGADGRVVYSTDPSLLYGAGIGNGFVDGTQYLVRGRRPTFSTDGSRLRWLENAARSDGSGDLMSALFPDPSPTLLAYNVRQFFEVSPGRTLAISNADGRGTYNRLILIDENQQQSRWVVDSTRAFTRIPNSTDVLASIVNGQTGYDVRRVTVPQ